ncbi:BTAD domain-containing putative transcriptional regulator [Streptomonospora litoralis]|uniref:HTH-type transcriptional regulator n=1 Tax=Streptomonospora litoralis TaxID=2498135 RepID=A0A4P6Q1J3_9ACTN|nr:BTAD domain-containing putative transcriptional regulator [Streptomonospora litoralis]QBI54363.1 Putative HTH-type transcriptional regulator [Streptomonospora litoralis]
MRFGVLGPLAVWDAKGALVRVSGAKVRALLADLLLHEGRPVPADRLIDDLWGEAVPGNPTAALQAKVSQLRRALEQAEAGGRARVQSGPAGYALRVDADDLDTARFAALAARARDSAEPRHRAELLAAALDLFRGGVCAEFADEEFVRTAAARWEEKRATAIEELAEVRLDLGEHRLLVAELEPLVQRYPLRERLRAVHIRALYLSGRQSEALEAYGHVRDHLSTELGLDPGPELVRLHQSILEQDPRLRAAESPAAARPRSNLPPAVLKEPFTGLIGRREAGAEVRARLDAGRLVTLAGPGGVGKTRLAVETAARAAEDFPDGVWLVELAARNPGTDGVEALADAVASTLGIREDAALGAPHGEEAHFGVVDRLTKALHGKRPLLILDNCEHLIEPIAELAGLLLGAVPEMGILATSHEPLGLAAELVYAVRPLELPSPDADAAELAGNPAVRLFTTRAGAQAPGFALDAGNASAVASICRRLDGIPLALELAATRVRTFGVHELANRIGDRFRILTTGHRNAPARHQTLRAMIDWSWELLPGPERAVLRRLAVHAEGCTLAAAEEVCAGGGIERTEVPDLLARLVDRSLVAAVEVATGGGPPTVRYRLLESVSAYCRERLEDAGESDDMRRRHAEFYTRLAESAEPHLRGWEQQEWLARLDAEAANLRAALDTAVRTSRADLALRLVDAMAWYWFLRGRHGEARRSLRAALEAGADGPVLARAAATAWASGVAFLTGQTDPAAHSEHALELYDRIDAPLRRARAQWLLAFSRSGAGDLDGSTRLVAQALTAFRGHGDRWGIAAALGTRAEHALVQGDLVAARQDSEASAALFEELGDRWGQAYAAQTRGMLAEVAGDYVFAARLHRRSLRTAEELGLWPSVSMQLAKLGRLSLLDGDIAEADEFHEKARRLAAEQGSGSGEAFALVGLALGARRRNRLDTAEEYLRRLLDWNRRIAYQPGVALALAERGFVAELRGDAETAAALHAEGLSAAEQTGDPRAVALALEGLGGAAAAAGDHRRAARFLGAAAAQRESVGAPLPAAERGDVDRATLAARTELGADAFDADFERGRDGAVCGSAPSVPG